MPALRTVLHSADNFRNRRQRKRNPLSRAARGWIIGGLVSLTVTVIGWLMAIVVLAAVVMFTLNLLVTPLDWLSAPFRAIGIGASDDDDRDESELQALDEARADFQDGAADGDPVLQCLLHVPEVIAVNQALYVGEVPAEVTTTVAGPDGRARETTVPVPNSELISDDDPVVAPGSQVIDAEGRPSQAVEGIVETIPQDTPAVIARAYLVTALAGGTTGFEHFEDVASRALDGRKVNADNAAAVAQAFFPTGTDLRPYYRVADAYVYRGVEDGVVRNEDGEGDFIYDRLSDCDDAVQGTTDTTAR